MSFLAVVSRMQVGIREYFKRKKTYLLLLDSLFDKYYHTIIEDTPGVKLKKGGGPRRRQGNQHKEVDQNLKAQFLSKYMFHRLLKFRDEFDRYEKYTKEMREANKNNYLLASAIVHNHQANEEDDLSSPMILIGEYRKKKRLRERERSPVTKLEPPKLFKLPPIEEMQKFFHTHILQKELKPISLTIPSDP